MIYNYNDVLKKYGSEYKILRALNNKEIYKLSKGVYSNKEFVNYLEVINKKYPNAIFSLESAFYYHKLTDVIPPKFFLATARKNAKINNSRILQLYVPDNLLNLGKTNLSVNGVKINIYDKERMLIELVKNRNKLPFDYYKEIISSYREIVNELDMKKLETYLKKYKNNVRLFDIIQREVF